MQKSIIISIVISIILIGGILYFVSKNGNGVQSQNVEIKGGVQYVTVTAQGGYAPRMSAIQPDIPTKLVVKTNGTYDCSAVLTVPSAGFQKILQPTGKEVIDLGTPKPGENIRGVCGMGMYGFQIKAMN